MDEKTFKAFEDFALSSARGETLAGMPPGTEVQSFLKILDHIQNYGSQAPDELNALIEAHSKHFQHNPHQREVELCHLLLKYEAVDAESQKKVLKALNEKYLYYSFEHSRPNYVAQPSQAVAREEKPLSGPSELTADKTSVKSTLSEAANDTAAIAKLSKLGLLQLNLDKLSPDCIKVVFSTVDVAEIDPQQFIAAVRKYVKKDKWTTYANLCSADQLTVAQLEPLFGIGDTKEDSSAVQAWLCKKFGCQKELTYSEQITHCKNIVKALGPISTTSISVSIKVSLLFHVLQLQLRLNRKGLKVFKEFVSVPRSANYLKDHSGFLSMFKKFGAIDTSLPQRLGMDTSCYVTEMKLVETYLFRFLKDQSDAKSLESYFNPAFITGAFAKIKMMAGDPDPKWPAIFTEKRSPSAYETLLKEKWLRFALHCPPLFSPTDPVTLGLNLKGVESLVIRTFEVNVNNYYRTTWKPLSSDLNLDGIIPNIEESFSFVLPQPKVHTFNYSSAFISEKTRGVFVVEAIGGGLSSRAVIRKGQLKCASRLTPCGHSICILNESNEVCKGASTGILLGSRFFPADEHGLVTVPYSSQPRSVQVIVQHEGYSELSDFQLLGENYSLTAGFVCPAESLVVGNACRVIVRAFLTVNGVECGVELLQKANVRVLLQDFDGVARTKNFPLGTLSSAREAVIEFQVPPKLRDLHFSLEAEVPVTSTGEALKLASSKFAIPVNSSVPTKNFAELYLRCVVVNSHRNYILQVLGRTGEGQSGVSISLNLQHKLLSSPLPKVVLVTDESGEVNLGKLKDVQSIEAEAALNGEVLRSRFAIGEQPIVFPPQQYCLAGRLSFPYFLATSPAAKATDKKLSEQAQEEVVLLKVDASGRATDNLTQTLVFQPDEDSQRSGTINCELQAGTYVLRYNAYGAQTAVEVASGEVWNNTFIISPTSIIDMHGADPVVRISSIKLEENKCEVKVRGHDSTCRVHILAYHFWEQSDPSLLDRLLPTSRSTPRPISVPKVASMYLNERKLGEEYSYVLERKTQERFLGCTLEKPQILLKRLYIQDTKTDIQEAKKGEEYSRQTMAGAAVGGLRDVRSLATESVRRSSYHDFLQVPALLLANLPLSADGDAHAEFDFSQFSHVVVVAVQGNSMTKRMRALPLRPVPKRDLACVSSLNPEEHYCQTLVTAPVTEFDTYLIEDVASVEMQLVDSVQKVGEAFKALGGKWMNSWEFLWSWNRISDKEKNDKYWEFASHELNFFLQRKDPDYFSRVIQPFLVHKPEKDIVDHFLLDTPGHDWTQYMSLTRLQRLNPFEQFLLLLKLKESNPQFCATAASRLQWQAKGNEFPPQRWMHAFEVVLQLETQKQASLPEAPSEGQPYAGRQPQMYRELEATKEFAETTYYGLKTKDTEGLLRATPFWSDAFTHALTGTGPFLSANFLYEYSACTGVLAMALLDLPLASQEHGFRTGQGREATLKAASNLLVFRKQIKAAAFDQQRSVLVAQRFFDPAEQFTYNDKNQKVEKPVEEFLHRHVYACQIILTNVSSVQQTFNVLWQLPSGALPVATMDYSKNVSETVGPFSTKTREFLFYFPRAGHFQMFPLQVAKNGVVVGAFHSVEIQVKEQRTIHDPTSLQHVLADGSTEALLNFIETQNIFDQQRTKFQFSDLLWLLKDNETFYLQLVSLLRSKRIFEESVWKFSMLHNDPSSLKELLQHRARSLAAIIGPWFESRLLTLRPEDIHYRHLEYAPIANARVYRLGQEKQILNASLKTQYETFIKTLAYTPAQLFTEKELIPLVYYLVLQDRIPLALSFFSRIEVKELTLQYDYLSAYFEFLQGATGFEAARKVMEKYRDYPVITWNRYFAEVRRQVEELDGQSAPATESRESRQDVLAASEPTLTARLETDEILFTCRNLRSVQVNYYVLDLEVYFSLNPFAGAAMGGFSYVKPSVTETIQVEATSFRHRLPEELRHKAVHIEVRAGALSQSLAYFNNSKLRVHTFEHKGQLRVTDLTGKGVPQVYVKAFAELKTGAVDFYKDGYTDLRGVFDYVSLNTRSVSEVQKFSLLVLDDSLGGLVRESSPPTI